MRTKLLSTVGAAALVLGFAAASAQTTMEKGGGAASTGATEKSTPSGAIEHGTPDEQRAPSMQKNPSERAQGAASSKPEGRAESKPDSKMDSDKAAQGGAATQPNSRMSQEKMGSEKMGSDKSDKMGTDRAADRAGPESGRTVGAAPSSETRLTNEQRTQIRERVITSGPRIDHVDFALNVGTRVPRDVRFADVPPVLLDIHPEWRGFAYFVVNDRLVIVDRNTMEIVAVLDV